MSDLHDIASDLEDLAADLRHAAEGDANPPRGVAALREVADLHHDTVRSGNRACGHCGTQWPCPTAEVLRDVQDLL